MAPVLPGPEARAPLALTDHVLEEVLIRIGAHADLIRASAACKTFRRLITDPAFLRRYRTLHPPMLLGFVGCAEPADIRFIPTGPAIRFQPAEAPHPNAPAARAFAAAADFSFDHHDDSGMSSWPRYDARDGRVLLMSSDTLRGSLLVSPVLSVYDPLTRACTQLPPIPDDLRTSVLVQYEHMSFFDALFDPSGANEEAPFREETQFRVMCLASCFLMTVVFVYSSVSGSWSHDTSIVFSALGLDLPPLYYPIMGGLHSYAYGCLYWDVGINNQMIKLDIDSMESSSVSLPLDHENRNTMFVEAGEGGIGMFSLILQSENPQSLYYSIWQNESENATEHPVENTIPLSSEYDFYHFSGAAGGYIFLIGLRKDFVPGSVFFSVEIKTLKVERVCEANFGPDVYWHFRPFMSPRRI